MAAFLSVTLILTLALVSLTRRWLRPELVWAVLGAAGFTFYAALLGYLLLVTARGPAAPLEVFTVVYLGFTLTWYDAAQFSHLPESERTTDIPTDTFPVTGLNTGSISVFTDSSDTTSRSLSASPRLAWSPSTPKRSRANF